MLSNKKITVLGAGMVGRTIARELAKQHKITSIDYSTENLRKLAEKDATITCIPADLSQADTNFSELVSDADLVISAVPGFLGYRVLEQIIFCGKNVVDISFFPESIAPLHKLAIEKNVTAVMDCGVAPGMSNLILGQYVHKIEVKEFVFYVGGLPILREPPFEYKAPFSPIDVIEEYTRPARLRKAGMAITLPALSERALIQFEELGELEGFNTDGLRSLLDSYPNIPDMSEKTLRYPGHAQLIETLQSIGFFKEEHLAATAKVLLESWLQKEDDQDVTAMKVIVRGVQNQHPITIEYSLIDYYDNQQKLSSMSRTTGYTCCAMAEWMLQGNITKKGVFPPEIMGEDDALFGYIIQYLQQRNVNWKKEIY